MYYRKLAAKKIFDGNKIVENAVLICRQNGIIESIVSAADAGRDIENFEGLLTPGFINCHCHLELSHMKGAIAQNTGLVNFVLDVVGKRQAPEAEVQQSIAVADAQMWQNGIVAVGDICNTAATCLQKKNSAIFYYNFIEVSGWAPQAAASRLAHAKALCGLFGLPENGVNSPHCAIVPHAPYSVSEDLWHLLQPYFEKRVVSIHNQETAFEDAFFLNGSGDFERLYRQMKLDNSHHVPTKKTSLQSYYQRLASAKSIILVHNTFTGAADVAYIKAQPELFAKTFFCLCVNANQYIEGALPPIKMMRSSGCKIVLGTDSLASNGALNILDEINTILENFPDIPLAEVLCWATRNGAEALGAHQFFGSFEPGKTPGVVLLSEDLKKVRKIL